MRELWRKDAPLARHEIRATLNATDGGRLRGQKVGGALGGGVIT